MVFQINIDDSDIDGLQADLKTMNIRAVADNAMHDILEDEFIPFLVSKIKAKGLVGVGPNKGPGPALASEAAWEVIRQGNMDYLIRTVPSVSERAFYLEFGTAELIFAEEKTEAGVFKFTSTKGPSAGDVIYPKVIHGVKEYSFFREAIQEFNAKDRLVDEAGDQIVDYIIERLHI